MKTTTLSKTIGLISILFMFFLPSPGQSTTSQGTANSGTNWQSLASQLGVQGQTLENGGYLIEIPRTDLNVRIDNTTIDPHAGLSAKLGFIPKEATGSPGGGASSSGGTTTSSSTAASGTTSTSVGNEVVMYGQIPLKESEVQPVLSALKNNFEVAAITNHFLFEQPRVIFVHLVGRGTASDLVQNIQTTLANNTSIPINSSGATTGGTTGSSNTSSQSQPFGADTEKVTQVLGTNWTTTSSGLTTFNIKSGQDFTDKGINVTPLLQSEVHIQNLNNGNAIAIGQLTTASSLASQVINQLAQNGFTVTGVHGLSLDSQPGLTVVHFSGKNTPVNIANGLNPALQKSGLQTSSNTANAR